MAITKIILQQMVTMDQNSITASKYPKYTVVLSNSISSITAAELTSAIESSKASAAAAKQSEINATVELNAKDSENEAKFPQHLLSNLQLSLPLLLRLLIVLKLQNLRDQRQ